MRTIRINTVLSIVFLLHATACNNERTQSVASPESVRLNNKGFEFWNEYRCNNLERYKKHLKEFIPYEDFKDYLLQEEFDY